jgi:hypothetical protein
VSVRSIVKEMTHFLSRYMGGHSYIPLSKGNVTVTGLIILLISQKNIYDHKNRVRGDSRAADRDSNLWECAAGAVMNAR